MKTVAEKLGPSKPIVGIDGVIDNVRSACARGLPTALSSMPHKGTWVMCGGGPSLKDSLKHIRRRWLSGETIACVNGSLKFLLDNGIVPHICVLLDPQPILAEQTIADARVDYLVASQCHPSVFELLDGCRVMLWHAETEGLAVEAIGEFYSAFELVPGPSTAPLKSLPLAYGMGFREFHLYGVDSCYDADDPKHHAYDQEADDHFSYCIVTVLDEESESGKEFITRSDWARQADEFKSMLDYLAPDARLYVHGEGLIPYIWKQRRHNAR